MNKFLDKTFGVSKSGSTIKTEVIAGLTTFFAMCYIVLVNPTYITGGLPGTESMWNAIFIGGTIAAIIGTLLSLLVQTHWLRDCISFGMFCKFITSALCV